LVTDCHILVARWRNHFSQLFSVHGINEIRQIKIHTAELLLPEPIAFVVKMAVEKLQGHKSPGIHQITSELIKAGGRTISSEIHKRINSILSKEELLEEWKESIIVPVCKKGDKTDCSNYRGISLLSTTYKILSNILLSRLTPYAEKLLGIICVNFNATSQLLILHSAFVKYSRRNGNNMKQCIIFA